MIYSLNGVLAYSEPYLAVVECAGVGYAVRTTLSSGRELPEIGGRLMMYTHMSVREDAVELFGFTSRRELECFKMLISVNGVGPKAALAILSELPPDKFMLAVAAGDSKTITRAPGVGPKLAGRIVLELGSKVTAEGLSGASFALPGAAAAGGGNVAEAIDALVSLGYSQSEAASAAAAAGEGSSVEEIIKQSLKKLSRG